MDARALFCLGILFAFSFLFLVWLVVGGTPQKTPTDERLEIERERNQIMREELEIRRAQAYMQMRELQQKEQTEVEPEDSRPLVRRGEVYRYRRQLPNKAPLDRFPDDDKFKKKQAEQDEFIERLKRDRRLE